MKVIVVRAHHREIESQSYMVGVFSTYEKAKTAISIEQERMGQSYDFSTAPRTIDSICGEPCEPEISLEERIEALEQYMNVAQNKIMALQSNLDFMLYLHRDEVGHAETRRRMDQVGRDFGRHK